MGWPKVAGGEELRAVVVHEVGPLQRCVEGTVTPRTTFESCRCFARWKVCHEHVHGRGWSQGLTLEASSTAVAPHLQIHRWAGWGFHLLRYRAPEREILVALKP